MKRRLVTVFVFLLLGAIVNVAVSWGLARFCHPPDWMISGGLDDVLFLEGRRFGLERRSQTRVLDVGSRPVIEIETVVTHRAGWPALSLERTDTNIGQSFGPGLYLPNEYRLFGPLWPGFAINTVFYAAALWLLFAAPFALRRRLVRGGASSAACARSVRIRLARIRFARSAGRRFSSPSRGRARVRVPLP